MKKWDRIIMLIIIIILIWIIWILLFNRQENSIQSDIFEKKKMCVEMRNSYEKYVIEKYIGNDHSMGDVELFYNSERDTCLWAFRYYWSTENETYQRFFIEDFMNWDEEMFKCGWFDWRKNLECEEQRKQKKIELWK